MGQGIRAERTITISFVRGERSSCASSLLLDILLGEIQEEFSLDHSSIIDNHSRFSNLTLSAPRFILNGGQYGLTSWKIR